MNIEIVILRKIFRQIRHASNDVSQMVGESFLPATLVSDNRDFGAFRQIDRFVQHDDSVSDMSTISHFRVPYTVTMPLLSPNAFIAAIENQAGIFPFGV